MLAVGLVSAAHVRCMRCGGHVIRSARRSAHPVSTVRAVVASLTGLPPEERGALSPEFGRRRERHHFVVAFTVRCVKRRPKAVGVADAGICLRCLDNKTAREIPHRNIVAVVRQGSRTVGSGDAAKGPGAIELRR